MMATLKFGVLVAVLLSAVLVGCHRRGHGHHRDSGGSEEEDAIFFPGQGGKPHPHNRHRPTTVRTTTVRRTTVRSAPLRVTTAATSTTPDEGMDDKIMIRVPPRTCLTGESLDGRGKCRKEFN
ncbi:hypothetical protein AAG570_003574 [Ranatra chinensis]|uniref:Secreted protein n=1 Tax=Ranatra chinensis TaxID=642074 RepID=A0ABD0Y595_9HEMI